LRPNASIDVQHVETVWHALEPDERGNLFTSPACWSWARSRGLHLQERMRRPTLWLACSVKDLAATRRNFPGARPVYMDHGTGLQWYGDANLRVLRRVAAGFAAPNAFLAERYLAEFAGRPVWVIGTPKLDRLAAIAREPGPATVAVSFHWTSVKRTRVLELFTPALRALVALGGVKVLGHGHPHVWGDLEPFYAGLGIEPVMEFEDVVARADVYACDHSSTIYEWAALGRPVVLLDHDAQQRVVNISSGLRYTDHADVGEHAGPETFLHAISNALERDAFAERRAEITAELYPYLGEATARAVEVLRSFDAEGAHGRPARRAGAAGRVGSLEPA